MHRIRKSVLVAGATLVFAFSATACSSGGGSDSPDTTTATTQENNNQNNQNQSPAEQKAECLKYNPVPSTCSFIP
ncbi:hypothetical protein LBMAG14_00920 [Actinomycetes bacterium]|nr:hypothetical protein LBMAG14_00920 [Actinomycetes bacterium]